MALASLPTIKSDSDWPIVTEAFDPGLLSSSFSFELSCFESESDFARVFATSPAETVNVVNSTSRIFSVFNFLPPSIHFFRKSARLVLTWLLLSLASISNSQAGKGSSFPCHPFCRTAKVTWPWARRRYPANRLSVFVPVSGLLPAGSKLGSTAGIQARKHFHQVLSCAGISGLQSAFGRGSGAQDSDTGCWGCRCRKRKRRDAAGNI